MRIAAVCLAVGLAAVSVGRAEDRVRPIERIAPEYPADAFEKEVAGKVNAVLDVDEDGAVAGVEILAESPKGFGFAEAAKLAFAKWKYPKNVPGKYKAAFTFAISPLSLTDAEKALPFAAPPISTARPSYPDKALDVGVSGDVILIATIDETGGVESVRAMRESPPGFGLADSAREAMSKYRFAPGERAVWTMCVRYSIEGEGSDSGVPEIAMPAKDVPMAPIPRRAGTPDYPYKARTERVEGVVELGIQIDQRGRISHAGLLSEKPAGYGFAENTYKALDEWRFRGAERGTYKLRVEFKLDD